MKKEKSRKGRKTTIDSPSKISKWQSLRNRLESGTLMKSLRLIKRGSLEWTHSGSGNSLGSGFGSGVGLGFKSTGKFHSTGGGGKFNAKLLILEAKSQHDATKKKQKERADRRRLLKKQRKLETQLEYLNFPTIMGFYFDGFFTPHFQLNEEYAVIFNELEMEIAHKKENEYKETFTEQAKRNFWPPEILAGYFFRTKGVYLDFKEILKDPPHTPPDIVTDPRTKAITLFVTDEEKFEAESKVASYDSINANPGHIGVTLSEFDHKYYGEDGPGIQRKVKQTYREQLTEEMKAKYIHKHSFYFDDSVPGFFKKKPQDNDRYYFDNQYNVWRIKRNPITFANDFYFDDVRGMFLAKDRTKPKDAYLYYPLEGCYREAGEVGPTNWRGLEPKHFYWNEHQSKWKRIKLAPNDIKIEMDKHANRHCYKNHKAKTPDDYYFDTEKFTYSLKTGKSDDYFYDFDFGAWRKKSDPDPQKAVINPNDFYWNEVDYSFMRKDSPGAFFIFDTNNRFFRKKKSVYGKFHPKNWIWNEKNKKWEVKKNTQSRFFSQSLHWRPDRDYEKPWLEYTGGYNKLGIYDKPDSDEDDDERTSQRHGKKIGRTTSEPLKRTGGLKEGTSATSLRHSKEKTIVDPTTGKKVASEGKTKEQEEAEMKEKSEETKKEMLVIADLYDMKILKIKNLGAVVNDSDIKAYFASVKRVVRPKIQGTNLTEDYAYLFFYTEEAAAAALKIMHNRNIKGQIIKLQYKHKDEDPEKGEVKKTK